MDSNWNRFRIRRMAANPLAIPKFSIPEQVKKNYPWLNEVFSQIEQAMEKHRQETQRTIEQNFMALKLDAETTTTVTQQTIIQETHETAPTVVKGPPGPPGYSRFPNLDTGMWVKVIVRGTPGDENRHFEFMDENPNRYAP